MKAILEFDFPDDEDRYIMAVNSLDYSLALSDIKAFIREQLKYGITMSDELLLETIRDMIPKDENI